MKFDQTCCGTAKEQLEYHCDYHGNSCPDQVLKFYPKSGKIEDQFHLLAENASYSAIFCPWCGSNLKETCIVDSDSIEEEDTNYEEIPDDGENVELYTVQEFKELCEKGVFSDDFGIGVFLDNKFDKLEGGCKPSNVIYNFETSIPEGAAWIEWYL